MRLRSLEVVLLVLAVVSLLFFGLARIVGARGQVRDGFVARIVRPAVAFWHEPVDVELRIDPAGLPSCAVTPVDVPPIYAALVIDHSGSMSGTPLAEARDAASAFADMMDLGQDSVTVVTFSDHAQLVIGFSDNRREIIRSIQRIGGGGGTDIAAGISLATQQFGLNPPPADALPVLILLSDGQSDPGAAIAAADQAKVQGIRVVTIALGDADRATLSQIASSPADFYEAIDPRALGQIYGDIAAGMTGSIATDATLEEVYNDERFELVPDSIYSAQQSGNHLTWNLPFVGGRGRSTGYELSPRSLGWHQVSANPGDASLTDCNGQVLTQIMPDGPRVLVLFPVWLLWIFPVLALLWAIFRLLKALFRRPPPQPVTYRPRERPDVTRGQVIGPERSKSRPGADTTHGRPRRHHPKRHHPDLPGGPGTEPPEPPQSRNSD